MQCQWSFPEHDTLAPAQGSLSTYSSAQSKNSATPHDPRLLEREEWKRCRDTFSLWTNCPLHRHLVPALTSQPRHTVQVTLRLVDGRAAERHAALSRDYQVKLHPTLAVTLRLDTRRRMG
jgi:hypothetical protein